MVESFFKILAILFSLTLLISCIIGANTNRKTTGRNFKPSSKPQVAKGDAYSRVSECIKGNCENGKGTKIIYEIRSKNKKVMMSKHMGTFNPKMKKFHHSNLEKGVSYYYDKDNGRLKRIYHHGKKYTIKCEGDCKNGHGTQSFYINGKLVGQHVGIFYSGPYSAKRRVGFKGEKIQYDKDGKIIDRVTKKTYGFIPVKFNCENCITVGASKKRKKHGFNIANKKCDLDCRCNGTKFVCARQRNEKRIDSYNKMVCTFEPSKMRPGSTAIHRSHYKKDSVETGWNLISIVDMVPDINDLCR
jgi:hypothetical protein